MDKPKNKNFANTASRISAIASSVMDLHVRIALQEVDSCLLYTSDAADE